MSYTTFIQWKGTDLCMDFNCPACGEHSHYDGYFAYHIRCGHCSAIFEMPDDIGPLLKRVPVEPEHGVLGPDTDE
jgi:uncharacterized protein (DUF983 family)